MKTKICNTCKKSKSISEFYQQSDKRYYNPNCKECCRLKSKQPLTLYKESIPDGFKLCSKCYQIKLLEEFYNDKKLTLRKSSQCKKCIQMGNSKWLKKNKRQQSEYRKEHKLKTRYNITIEDYNKLLIKQNNICAICGKEEISTDCKGKIRKLSVDHNHSTGKVRGLLCGKCNQGIGNLDENIYNLKMAIRYLEK